MAGQTPNYQIPFPQMTDRANISIVESMMNRFDAVGPGVVSGIQTQFAKWERIPWNPVMSGMTIGNGVFLADAFRFGKLIWLSFAVFAVSSGTVTTAWTTNVTPTFPTPVRAAEIHTNFLWHYPGAGGGFYRLMTAHAHPAVNYISLQCPVVGSGLYTATVSLDAWPSRAFARTTWGNSGTLRGSIMYRGV